ncbi:MAG: hypothetical protein NTW05_13685 [Pseudonocardiales bacterium]|nr:hypothetical protein [Pseudonocardiales bacterium]
MQYDVDDGPYLRACARRTHVRSSMSVPLRIGDETIPGTRRRCSPPADRIGFPIDDRPGLGIIIAHTGASVEWVFNEFRTRSRHSNQKN